MRNHVSKVLVGTSTANLAAGPIAISALTNGQVIAFDADSGIDIKATTKNIAFARGTAIVGQPIVAGPIPVAGITSAVLNPYKAPVNKVMTLTVSTVPTVGKTAIIKVIYHDNLSIIPNQIKQTAIAITANSVNAASTTTWATAIKNEFNKQLPGGFLFVTVTSATNVVTITGQTLLTASVYNKIDKPEVLNFEVGAPDVPEQGVYVVATTVALSGGQGTAAQVAYMEDQAMGRQGFSDRRSWNNNKPYISQVTAGQTYATLVINADIEVEGDMQGTRKNPIGAVISGQGASVATILTDLSVAGVVPVTVAAG